MQPLDGELDAVVHGDPAAVGHEALAGFGEGWLFDQDVHGQVDPVMSVLDAGVGRQILAHPYECALALEQGVLLGQVEVGNRDLLGDESHGPVPGL